MSQERDAYADRDRILGAIAAKPCDPGRWLAFPNWLADNGRYDKGATVRVFCTVPQDNLQRGATLEYTLGVIERNAARLAPRARLRYEEATCERKAAPSGVAQSIGLAGVDHVYRRRS